MYFSRRISVQKLILPLAVIIGFATQAHGAITWETVSQPARLLKELTRPQCPKGFETSQSGSTTYCLVRKLVIPAKAKSDCEELESGQIGFTYPSSKKGYSCPEGMSASQKGKTQGCYFKGLTIITDGTEVRAYCKYLDRGYLGFTYH